MTINRENYELYALDYLEGRLSIREELQMKKFLSDNPDILEEVNSLETPFDINKNSVTIDKSTMFRSISNIAVISPENFEEFCIAYYERDLDVRSSAMLKEYIQQQPKLMELFELYARLIFSPDRQVKYPKKGLLRKLELKAAKKNIYALISVIAASLIIILLFYLNSNKQSSFQFVSQNKQPEYQGHIAPSNLNNYRTNYSLIGSKIETDHHIHFLKKQLAAVDSSNRRQNEKVVLASVQPILPIIKGRLHDSKVILQKNVEDSKLSETTLPENSALSNLPSTLPTRILAVRNDLLWKVLHLSINGINSLTENDLALHTEKNSAGRLSEIALQSDNFEITRKIGRNMQN
jgi:hypothetical protein